MTTMPMPTVHLICNAHLDPVWLWQWEEGCAEALSTFSTAVELLKEHPTLIFNHNEALLYRWVKNYAPGLFGEIQDLVAAGRWAISGGWYLQPDVNLPGTESLIRHMALGRRFFREHFAVEPKTAYNFDSFGHSAGLPQLLRQAGFEMYIHMRPQAPELELPSDLYRWRGLDGSEILALRIMVGLYHTERHNIEERLQQGVELALKLNRDVPVFWGIGDHGGGPTREDLRRIDDFIAREKRVAIVHSTPDRLYEALRVSGQQAPLFAGDLQRVFTGCYTSLARLKRQAVRSLGTLRQTEALRAASWWQLQQAYPTAQLDEAWRDHLFNDFHDILPGTCIEPAEHDALGLYARVAESCRRLVFGAAAAFNAGSTTPAYIPVTILNSNAALRRVPVEVECMLDLRPKWSGQWHLKLVDSQGCEQPCQEEQPESLLPFNGWRRKVAFVADLPALGAAHYELQIHEGEVRPTISVPERGHSCPQQAPDGNALPPVSKPSYSSHVAADRNVRAPAWWQSRGALDFRAESSPPALRHRLDPSVGLVTSLDAGDQRECLAGPLLKPLVVDDPGDSWGTEQWAYRKIIGEFAFAPGSLTQLAAGPIRTITETVHTFGHSRIVLYTIAYSGIPVLEFRLRIHWLEERRRLKLSIPTVFRPGSVLCEVPGGAWLRPADGQEHVHGRWLMLEGVAGGRPTALAVVHEGLHGFDVKDGEIRLSALRGAAYCHEQGLKLGTTPTRKFMDQGVHNVRLLVIADDPAKVRLRVAGLADWISAPPRVFAHLPIGVGAAPDDEGLSRLLEAIPQSVAVLACKRSWDGRALVLRLQEICGTRAEICDPRSRSTTPFMFRPFEIKTLRLGRDGSLREVDLIREMGHHH
jgi:alpha-mannosidase